MIVSNFVVSYESYQSNSTSHGYGLRISNLEEQPLTFDIFFNITPPSKDAVWKKSLDEHLQFFFGEDVYWMNIRRHGGIYIANQTFTVQPKQTISVGVIPRDSEAPDVEGYVELEVPVIRDRNLPSPFRPRPQFDRPVRLLLNPEATMKYSKEGQGMQIYDKNGYYISRTGIRAFLFDAIEPIVPATGKAENEIVPNGLWILKPGIIAQLKDFAFDSRVSQTPSSGQSGNLDQLATLLDLLCELQTDERTLRELNLVLEQNKADLRLSKRTR